MTRRFSICQTCHKVVDLDWDAHDGGSDDQGRECWYCPACCPAPQCNDEQSKVLDEMVRVSEELGLYDDEPSDADMRRVDL